MKCKRCGKENAAEIHTCTPLALVLADKLEQQFSIGTAQGYLDGEAAAELRRLHEAHEWQYTMAGERLRRIEKLEAENEALQQELATIKESLMVQEPVAWAYQWKNGKDRSWTVTTARWPQSDEWHEYPLYRAPQPQPMTQPQQEPVAWMTHAHDPLPKFHRTYAAAKDWGANPVPLYTAPQPQRDDTALLKHCLDVLLGIRDMPDTIYWYEQGDDLITALKERLK